MRNKGFNLVFFGIDSFSNVVLNSLIDSPHSVKLVVCHYYDESAFQQLNKTCINNDIPIIRVKTVNSEEVLDAVKKEAPDYCIIAHFERIIKKELIAVPKHGFINLHPSLLPNYRGLAPQHYPIINGEKEVGITVHYIDEGTDTGDIILQKSYPLTDDMYVADLHALWLKEYKSIMVEALERVQEGADTISQKGMEGTFYPKMKDEVYPLDPRWSVNTAYNWVRAMSLPYKGVSYGDMVIFRARIMKEGEVLDEDEKELQFSDGSLIAEWYE